MNLKLSQIWESQDALAKLASKDLPFSVSYQLSKLIRTLDGDLKFLAAERERIFRKFGEETAPNTITIPPDRMGEANAALTELFDAEVEVVWERMAVPAGLLEGVQLSPLDWANLATFVQVEG